MYYEVPKPNYYYCIGADKLLIINHTIIQVQVVVYEETLHYCDICFIATRVCIEFFIDDGSSFPE